MNTIETKIAELTARFHAAPSQALYTRIERLCRIAGLPTQVWL